MATDPQNDNKPDRLHKSRYAKKYPYNQTWVTEAGHEFHVDDTPGKERLRMAHKSGSYIEMTANGKVVTVDVGHSQHYTKGGHTHTIDKNYDLKVAGSHRTNVSGHAHEEIRGTQSSAIGGNHKTIVGGDHVMAVKGDQVVGVVGDRHESYSGNANVKIDGTMNVIVDGKGEPGPLATGQGAGGFAYTLSVSDGGINIFTKGKMVFLADSDITMVSGSHITLQAPKVTTIGRTELGDSGADKALVVNVGGVEYYASNAYAFEKAPMPPD